MTADDDTEERAERPSIEERAARREYVEKHGQDRYDSLLRHLQAGREVTVAKRGRRFEGLDWHPIAGKLLLAVAVGVALYLVASTAFNWWRENRVDTWAGPDTCVQSGQRLASCPQLVRRDDPVFPNWIRYDGGIFERTEVGMPIGSTNIGTSYVESGYSLDDVRIYDVTFEGLGPIGSRILVRNGEAPAGQVYRLVEGCV